MQLRTIYKSLLILLVASSCAAQDTNHNENSLPISQETKIQAKEEPRLPSLQKEEKNYMPGQILVKFKAGTEKITIQLIQKKLHLVTIRIIPKSNVYLMKILNGSSVKEIRRHLMDFSEVEYAEPNYMRKGYKGAVQ